MTTTPEGDSERASQERQRRGAQRARSRVISTEGDSERASQERQRRGAQRARSRAISTTVRPKAFGIGLSKTGTTSLASALGVLGYRTVHYPPLHLLPELLADFDAATDTSVACLFRELDARYPGARFILTIRDRPGWLASARREFAGRPVAEPWKREVRTRVYGTLDWQPASFLAGYERHVAAVREHFASRPADLLVLDIFAGDPWPALCAFLDCPVPEVPFPHENAGFVGARHAVPG